MNLSDMEDVDAKRLVDFAAGLIFGLRGSIERVTSKVVPVVSARCHRGSGRQGADRRRVLQPELVRDSASLICTPRLVSYTYTEASWKQNRQASTVVVVGTHHQLDLVDLPADPVRAHDFVLGPGARSRLGTQRTDAGLRRDHLLDYRPTAPLVAQGP